MPSLKTVQASNVAYAPKYTPTAVFIGGTSGIGRAMAEAFAKQTNGNANIIIVGRNKAAAEEIIASFPTPSSSSHVKHEFVSCDAQELKNVHETSQLLLKKLEKLNLLVLSPGGLALSRKDTAEGNDASIVLRSYSRVKFARELMPLLEKAAAAGEEARVTSILAAGKGGSPDLQDLNVTKWTFIRAMLASGTYNDIAVKMFSEQHPNLTFIHIYPGLVDTPAMRPNWWMSTITTLLKPFIIITPEVCAQFMLYPLLSPEFASGGYLLDQHAEKVTYPKNLEGEVATKVWEHLVSITETK